MNKRIVYSLFALLAFALLASGSFDGNKPEDSKSASSTSTSAKEAPKPAEDLQVLENSVTSSEYGTKTIVGTVRNNTSKTYGYVQVSFNLYDATGAQVGSAMDNINNLEPHGIWRYKAMIMEGNVATVKFKEITGY